MISGMPSSSINIITQNSGQERGMRDSDQEGGLRLGRFAAAIKRHSLIVLGVTTLTASAAVLKAVTTTPDYQADLELLTPPNTLESQIVSTISKDPLSEQSEILSATVDETKLKILKSPRVMEPIVVDIQRKYPELTYRQVVNRLSISTDKTGNTLVVRYGSKNPAEVTDVLNAVSAAYLKYSLENRQNAVGRGIDFVNKQLPVARQRVQALETKLEALRQSANLIDPLAQGEQLSSQAASFASQQLELRVQIKAAQEIYRKLQQELNEAGELAATSVLLDSTRYQGLLNQLLAVDSELADQLTLYSEGSPELEVIEERRQNLQPLLRREGIRVQRQVENSIRELQDRDRALSQTIGSLNQQIKDLSTTARLYASIQRELDIAAANLNQFLTKRETLKIDAAQRQSPWEVLSPPSLPRPASVSTTAHLALGTILGLLLGSGMALVVDFTKGKINTAEELTELSGLPLLGTIPYAKDLLEGENAPVIAMSQFEQLGLNPNMLPPGSFDFNPGFPGYEAFLEAFRVLSTNIHLSNPETKINAFAVSSAIPNMGKSIITFHLAYAMAAAGRKVLMIDADLRNPSLHELCNVKKMRGISNYVAGECELEEVISELPIEPNLYLLPAGPVPPDPIRILTAERMQFMLNHVREQYDVVIVDTPPILGFADALVLSASTQGLLLTATLGEIKFNQMQAVLDQLGIAKIPVLGLVANASKQKSQAQYSYNQYYRKDKAERWVAS